MSASSNELLKLQSNHPRVILCEGRDEKCFLIWYLEYLQTTDHLPDEYDVLDLGGIEEMNNNLPNICKLEHYDEMKSVLIVRDAEKDARRAVASLKSHLKESIHVDVALDGSPAKDETGIQWGFVLLPGKDDNGEYRNGTLEDLCWSILAACGEDAVKEKIQNGVKEYLAAAKGWNQQFSVVHKNRLHTYFSGTDEFVGMKIGEAAKSHCFDFGHKRMQFLHDAILAMGDI